MTLYDDVAAALAAIDGLAVVDPADPTQQIALPVAYLGYGGHERPTGADLKAKIVVAVVAAWAQNQGAHRYTAILADRITYALEAMDRARLLSSSGVVELATPADDEVVALGIELVVISA